MARPRNTDTRRAEIVDALRKLLPELGYERASTAAIAQAAGLSTGLVHYHFRNKQAILVALVDALWAGLHRRFERRAAAASGEGGTWRAIEAYLEAHLELGGGDADPGALACWVVIAAEAVRQPEVREVYVRALEHARDLLEGLLGDLLLEEDRDPDAAIPLAATVLSTIHGAYALGTAAPGVLPQGFAARSVVAMLRAMVASVGPASGVEGVEA